MVLLKVSREYAQMQGRVAKLRAFIQSDKFVSLPLVQQKLLREQLEVMQDYVLILRNRIDLMVLSD
jgi:hypothetical protein